MKTIYFNYRNPKAAALQSRQRQQLSTPTKDLLTEWRRFAQNISAHFPDKDRNWMVWQFEQACYNQNLAVTEIHCPLLESILRSLAVPCGYFDRPGIITTFHYASYRILGKWLAAQGVPFRLLVASQVVEEQAAVFRRALSRCLTSEEAFGILDAEDPKILFKIRKTIQQGQMVLAYLDGNIGGERKTDPQRRHSCPIPLRDGSIDVRIGVGYMASWLQVPVYPIWSIRDVHGLGFILHDPIEATRSHNTATEAAVSMVKHVYGMFAESLIASPALWENWFFLDEFKTKQGEEVRE